MYASLPILTCLVQQTNLAQTYYRIASTLNNKKFVEKIFATMPTKASSTPTYVNIFL